MPTSFRHPQAAHDARPQTRPDPPASSRAVNAPMQNIRPGRYSSVLPRARIAASRRRHRARLHDLTEASRKSGSGATQQSRRPSALRPRRSGGLASDSLGGGQGMCTGPPLPQRPLTCPLRLLDHELDRVGGRNSPLLGEYDKVLGVLRDRSCHRDHLVCRVPRTRGW